MHRRIDRPMSKNLLIVIVLCISVVVLEVFSFIVHVGYNAWSDTQSRSLSFHFGETYNQIGVFYKPNKSKSRTIANFAIHDRYLIFRNKPNSFIESPDPFSGGVERRLRINEIGFVANSNDVSVSEPILESDFNIFITGGSTVASWGASSNEQTFISILERLLNERIPEGRRLKKRVHVINAGVPSYNSTQELIYIGLDLIHQHPSAFIMFNGINERMKREAVSYNWHWSNTFPRTSESSSSNQILGLPIIPATQFLAVRVNRRIRKISGQDEGSWSQPGYRGNLATYKPAIERYAQNVRNAAAIVTSEGLHFFYVLQPTTGITERTYTTEEIKWQNLYGDEKKWDGYLAKLKPFYADVRNNFSLFNYSSTRAESKIYDGTAIFDDVKESVYLDPRHYRDLGQEVIAEYLYDILTGSLSGQLYE